MVSTRSLALSARPAESIKVRVHALIGRHPLWGGLLASYDEGGWVGLLLDDVEGEFPDLDDNASMARLAEATDELVAGRPPSKLSTKSRRCRPGARTPPSTSTCRRSTPSG